MKTIRKKVLRATLEHQLEKYGRRIQKLADQAYRIRQALESLDAKENENAVHNTGSEGVVASETSGDSGGINVPDSTTPETVLDEQPA